MNFVLTHCYTDNNKGDVAIILATIQLIQDLDKNADITLLSTYGINDPRFTSDHNTIKQFANRISPSFFPEPIFILGIKSNVSRFLNFIAGAFKSLVLLLTKNKSLLTLLFKKEEIDSINLFLNSDIIIAKGGSYLYSENTSFRQSLSLIRMLYPFALAIRYNKKIVIFSQSLGPVEGSFNQWLFKKILSKVHSIYLRESLCIDNYPYVKSVCSSSMCYIIPDSAFYLKNTGSEKAEIKICDSQFNVGYTIVDHDFKYINSLEERKKLINNYKESIINSIKYLIDKKDAIIHIFPQVKADVTSVSNITKSEMRLEKEIVKSFEGSKYFNNIKFYTDNWSPTELRNLYKKMNTLIGTRLHSVILSLSAGTPAINISYHGTKSRGILKQITGFEKYVIDINLINSISLIDLINEILMNESTLRIKLKDNITEIENDLLNAMSSVINNEIKASTFQ